MGFQDSSVPLAFSSAHLLDKYVFAPSCLPSLLCCSQTWAPFLILAFHPFCMPLWHQPKETVRQHYYFHSILGLLFQPQIPWFSSKSVVFPFMEVKKEQILEGSIPEIQIPALPNGETSGRPLNVSVPCFSSINREVTCLARLLSSHTHGKQLVNSRHTVEAQKCLFPLPFKINVRHGQKNNNKK